jgi:uncharacterized protein
MREHTFRQPQSGAALAVKVSPNAKRDEVVGAMSDGTVKISLKAKPVEGAANEALIALLADRLGVPKSQIDIVAGQRGTKKLVSIIGLTPAEVDARLFQGKSGSAAGQERRASKK